MSLLLRELTVEDLPVVERWFRDPETDRWLGDESWPRRLLILTSASTRLAFAATCDSTVVGIADIECYSDARAAAALVVAPDRRRLGIGRALAEALPRQPQLNGIVEFFGGVEEGNVASEALVTSAGFEQVTDAPDDEGFTYFALRVDGARPARPWLPPRA